MHAHSSYWGAQDVWSSAPQLMSCDWFVGSWPPFITGLLYDDPPPSRSQQIAYKTLVARQLPTNTRVHTYTHACLHTHTHTNTPSFSLPPLHAVLKAKYQSGSAFCWVQCSDNAGFSPHWSGAVGSNHHSAIFTTTQQFLPPLRLVLPPLTEGKNFTKCWNTCLMQFDSTFAKV